MRARAAGQAYAAGVAKQRTGHSLGSPHVHVAITSVEGMVVMGEGSQMLGEAAVLKVLAEGCRRRAWPRSMAYSLSSR